ncbi:MAG: indolepyruvate oxidoreductase subunit beta [Spirochaetaceae bacterium]|jgi:indolepyruvate ferredoxin oxidoreductase beta subunit|nr:indolepyruvate oxidoreductase subunit beta [Spirochaetaceae bacterium]
MKTNIILAGVGGQGVLSIAAVITAAAVKSGFKLRQSEVHGMAQRGGSVFSHIRISDDEIYCDIVPRGRAELIISMEPLEGLRYLEWLSPSGKLVIAEEPFININNYPSIKELNIAIKSIPGAYLIPAETLAKNSGHSRSVNMVMIGAASIFLPVKPEILEDIITEFFVKLNPVINVKAFKAGRDYLINKNSGQ